MSTWFTLQPITKDIYQIVEPYYREHANLYLITGHQFDLLIDGGLGLANVKSFLVKCGFKPRLFLTHAHFDHSGGLKHFLPHELMITRKVADNLKKGFCGKEFLRPEDFNKLATKKLLKQDPTFLCEHYTIPFPSKLKPYSNTSIRVGNYMFRIIMTPGHTDDSLIIYEPKHRLLITGDTLYDGQIYKDLPNSNRSAFTQSLAKLATLRFRLVLPGHNALLPRNQALRTIQRWREELKKTH